MAGYQVEFVKRKIVQYIHEERLQDGDRLPPQRVLCSTLNVGAATISSAIRELAQDNIVRVLDKVGVLVGESDVSGRTGRLIGITPGLIDASPYTCCLSHQLQLRMLKRGCRPVVYYCRNLPDVEGFELETFPGLRNGIENREIDALIDMTRLSDAATAFATANGIEIFYAGLAPASNRNRIGLSLTRYEAEALSRLQAEGCRNLAVVCPNMPAAEWDGCRELPGCGLTSLGDVFDVPACLALVRRLLALPAQQRPDGLVFFDDLLAANFIAELRCLQDNTASGYWLPWVATLANQQIPVGFASPKVLKCVIDLEQMADWIVEAMLKKLQGKCDGGLVDIAPPCQWQENNCICK